MRLAPSRPPAAPHWHPAAILLLVLSLTASRAASAQTSGPAAPGVGQVQLTTTDGQVIRGELHSIAPEIVVHAAAQEHRFAWEELLSLRPVATAEPASPSAAQAPMRFMLTDGSEFGGRIDSSESGALVVRLAEEQSCKLSLDALAAIVTASADDAARRILADTRAEPDRLEDVAVVMRGPRPITIRGSALRLDAAGIRFLWRERELPLPWDRLAGIVLARPAAAVSAVAVRLRNGDTFTGRIIAGDATSVRLRSRTFENLELPWARIDHIESLRARALFLSAVEPASFESESVLGRAWPLAVDRTLTGRPIRLGGRPFERGLTMHSRARAVYEIGGVFRSLAAHVGIAEDAGPLGDAAVRVVGDGRTLWEAPSVRAGQPPLELAVDVSGVRTLELIVDYGSGLDLGDHVVWANARLTQ